MDPIERFDLFAARCEELASTRLIRDCGLRSTLSLKYRMHVGFSMETAQVDEDDLRSFLLTVRQFVSSKEPIYLFSIYNHLFRAVTSSHLRECLVESREVWKRSLKGKGFNVTIDGSPYQPEVVADLWINGWYFHNDSDQRTRLQRLVPEARLLVRWMFLDYLVDTANQVFYVDHVLKIARREGWLSQTN